MPQILSPRAQMTVPLVSPFFPKTHKATLFRSSPRYSQPLYAAPTLTVPSITNTRRQNTSFSNQQRPTRLIVVYGYGCDAPGSIQYRRNSLAKIRRERKKFTYIDVLCNQKRSKSMTANIARRIAYPPNSLQSTAFVQDVLHHVVSSLLNGERVTLMGYSYGGSIVSRVAIELKKRFGKVPHLKAITLGSIYIPAPEKTNGINIRHYVYDNDIAKVCHKRSKGCPFVRFLKPKRGYGPLKSHLNYHDYITAVATTGSTNLNRIV